MLVVGLVAVRGVLQLEYLSLAGCAVSLAVVATVGILLAFPGKLGKFLLPALVVLGIVVLVTVITDYIVVGTTTTVLMVPSYLGWAHHSFLLAGILLIGTLVILYKHRENYVRMANGTEIGLRSAAKGERRIKK